MSNRKGMVSSSDDFFMTAAEIVFRCPNAKCHSQIVEVVDQLPSYDLAADAPLDGDGLSIQFAQCVECGTNYEVMISAHLGDLYSASIVGEPNAQVEVQVDENPYKYPFDYGYERYVQTLPIVDPYKSFEEAMIDLKEVIESQETYGPLYAMQCRMIFVQLIGVMEAYLADRLITLVLRCSSSIDRAIYKIDELKVARFTLREILDNPDIVNSSIKAYLQSISFHDLSRVNEIYGRALGRGIFDKNKKDNMKLLLEATIKRHDCVHRNGKDKNGFVRADIDLWYIRIVFSTISSLVEFIEDQFKNEIAEISL